MYKQIDSNKRKSILLIAIFVVFIFFLSWIFGEAQGGYGYETLAIALIFSLFMTATSYFGGDKVALWSSGAQGPIKKEDNPYVYRLVENLCITAGLPVPKIYLIPDPAPNAFATGRDPKHASIALTTGLVERLENEELEGVIAHELSHIKNYDIRLMMLVIVMVGIVVLLSNWMIRHRFFSGRRDNHGGGQLDTILILVGVALAILAPLFATFIKLAISRKREFLADADGALLTRYPEGLAKALEKISNYKEPMRRANDATAHLYISNPFGEKKNKFFHKLFSTHPPAEERIKTLRGMA